MVKNSRTRRERLLDAAEGYLTLDMPTHALASLAEIADPETVPFAIARLRGEALRNLQRYDEALDAFNLAFAEDPENISLLLAMAWCYKRTDQLPRAITAMEQAYRIDPKDALILYNLSCYWALAGNKSQALSWLGRALRMDGDYRKLIAAEHDFDPIRHDPDFQLIVADPGETHA